MYRDEIHTAKCLTNFIYAWVIHCDPRLSKGMQLNKVNAVAGDVSSVQARMHTCSQDAIRIRHLMSLTGCNRQTVAMR